MLWTLYTVETGIEIRFQCTGDGDTPETRIFCINEVGLLAKRALENRGLRAAQNKKRPTPKGERLSDITFC
jgi:hypothetical protein